MKRPVAVALTGASGSAYGLRLIECLLQAKRQVQVLYSEAAQVVLATELGITLPQQPKQAQEFLQDHFNVSAEQIQVYGRKQWMAPVASGSNPPEALVICPCSTGTMAAIAHGMSDNLIERAADVMLKERKKLILMVRETPLSSIHLQNMLQLSQAGALIMPASPGFYYQPEKIADLVDFMVARVLDHLHIEHDLIARWGS